MRAAWFNEFGAANDVLEVGEMETPVPAANEVLVRVFRSAVNPSDVKKRAGSSPTLLDDGPVIPHSDGAGVVEAVGSDVASQRVGQRVWIYQAQHGRRLGTAATHVCIDSRRAPELPKEAGFDIGACLGIPAMTAHRCVFADGAVNDQAVLITGGAGRVGHYAIQWAAQSGARVIATASSEHDQQACMDAGAIAVVNHRAPGWGKMAVQANGDERIDRVIDLEFGVNLGEVLDAVKTSGKIVTYGSAREVEPVLPFYRMMFMDLVVRMVIVYDMPESAKDAAIKDINDALTYNRLVHRIAKSYPLSQIASAHELIEAGEVRGCVLIDTE